MSSRPGARKPYSRPAPRGDVDGQWVHDMAPSFNGRPSRAPAQQPHAASNTKLIVSNLHYEITSKDLISIFGQIGTLVREPLIRYDRSGRSTGSAIISFETAPEATRAKKQYDGILAKGQPMSIAYDTAPPRQPRRSASVPSLINRIQKPPLADRLSRDDVSLKAPSGPRGGGTGPIRSKPIRAPRGPKKPKTAEELDKELDAFMGDSEPAVAAPAEVDATAAAETVATATEQDVEMA